jgi:hypothetical protein
MTTARSSRGLSTGAAVGRSTGGRGAGGSDDVTETSSRIRTAAGGKTMIRDQRDEAAQPTSDALADAVGLGGLAWDAC